MTINSQNGYITSADSDYNFGYDDFTVEFFAKVAAVGNSTFIWIVNNVDNTVSQFSPSGNIIHTFSVGNHPNFIATDSEGNAWVTNTADDTVTKLSSTGVILGTFSVGTSPLGITVDSQNNVWIANGDPSINSNNISKLSPNGSLIFNVQVPFDPDPFDIVVDSTGNVWADYNVHPTIIKISSDGTILGTYPLGPYFSSVDPEGMAIDSEDNVWIAATGADIVFKMSSTGVILGTFAAGIQPTEVAIDSTGNIWITNQASLDISGNGAVTKLSSTGVLLGTFITGNYTQGISIDNLDNIWVTNTGDNTVMKLSLTGQILGTFPVGNTPIGISAGLVTGPVTQTLFEITNNESPAAALYETTEFLTVIDNGNIKTYATQNPSGNILFQSLGGSFTADVLHLISVERYQNELYLFLDGQLQTQPANIANIAIPSQLLTLTGNTSLDRTGFPALLTIGADKNGLTPFYGEFGDFKILRGTAKNVPTIFPSDIISSTFTDSNLGLCPANIVIDGSNFVDSISSHTPEELVPAQIFDTTYLTVYQSDNSNLNANIINFSLFKPTILSGPIGSYSFNISNPSIGPFIVPWRNVNSASATILIENIPIDANSWTIQNNRLFFTTAVIGNVEIIVTGPTTYYSIGPSNISYLTSNVYANSLTINVASTSGFYTPITANIRGQIFINQECITYLGISGNSLTGLMRGTSGTGIPDVHVVNTQVVSASIDREIQTLSGVDPTISIWYANQTSGTSLQNTYTTISNTLVSIGSISPTTPF